MTDSIDVKSIKKLTGGDGFYMRTCKIGEEEPITIGSIMEIAGSDSFFTRSLNDSSDELIEAPSRSTYCGDIYSCALKDYQKRLRLKQEELREGELDRDTHLQYGANVYSDKQLKERELNNTDKFCSHSANLGTIGKISKC